MSGSPTDLKVTSGLGNLTRRRVEEEEERERDLKEMLWTNCCWLQLLQLLQLSQLLQCIAHFGVWKSMECNPIRKDLDIPKNIGIPSQVDCVPETCHEIQNVDFTL